MGSTKGLTVILCRSTDVIQHSVLSLSLKRICLVANIRSSNYAWKIPSLVSLTPRYVAELTSGGVTPSTLCVRGSFNLQDFAMNHIMSLPADHLCRMSSSCQRSFLARVIASTSSTNIEVRAFHGRLFTIDRKLAINRENNWGVVWSPLGTPDLVTNVCWDCWKLVRKTIGQSSDLIGLGREIGNLRSPIASTLERGTRSYAFFRSSNAACRSVRLILLTANLKAHSVPIRVL